jgi:hypothetical protein
MSGKKINIKVKELQPDFEKAEIDLLRAAITRTDTERFNKNDWAYKNEFII